MILNENLFEDYEEVENAWEKIKSKAVPDSDGFLTDYTWYTNGKKHIFMFGDEDIYEPDEDYADWEIEIAPGKEHEAEIEAQSWFDNYEGMEDSDDSDINLEEAYSPSLPVWLINYLDAHKDIKKTLSNKLHYDLANMKFIKIPKEEMPSNGFHPILKDTTKQLIYLLRDNTPRNVVYMPGVNDDIYVKMDDQDPYKDSIIRNVSKKKILDYTVMLGYIESTDDSNRNLNTQKERKNIKNSYIERGKGQYQMDITSYPTKEDGSKDWDNPTISKKWVNSSTFDKSGYVIDKDKYKRMLDQANLETYGNQYIRYTKKLEALRDAIIEYMGHMSLTKRVRDSWLSTSLSSLIKYFEDAIYDFENLQSGVDRIINSERMTKEEKDKAIQEAFDSNSPFSYIKGLRKNIEDAWAILKSLNNPNRVDESLEDEETPMIKLAKKHNLDILTPMGGDLRVSGTVKDLDAFYKEAQSLDLLTDEIPLDESINIDNFSEFKEIANEVGINTLKDYESFKKEEIQPGESALDAIKRYKNDLMESNIDFNLIKKKNLFEGAMSDLDLDIQNGATFSSVLKDELVPLKKKLYRLEDNGVKEGEEIEKIKDEISKVEAKLMILSKKEKSSS